MRPEANRITAKVAYQTNQPTRLANPDLYTVECINIQSYLEGSSAWKEVYHRTLQPSEKLHAGEEAVIDLDLTSADKICEFRVVLHYKGFGKVISPIYEGTVEAISKSIGIRLQE